MKTGKISAIILTGLLLVGVGVSQSSGTPPVSLGSNGVQINSGSLGLGGGDITDGGTTVWDSSNGYVPKANIQNLVASDVGLGNVENVAAVNESGDTMTGNMFIDGAKLEIHEVAGSDSLSNVVPGQIGAEKGVLVNYGTNVKVDNGEWGMYLGETLKAGDQGDLVMRSEGSSVVIADNDNDHGGPFECWIDETTGSWNCDGTKNWVHSLNSTHDAYYTSQESPEVRTVYEGKVNVEGKTRVELPEHFSGTVSDTEPKLRATATVQGELAYAAVIEKTDDYIVLDSSNPATVNFRITGIRDGYEDKQVVRPKNGE